MNYDNLKKKIINSLIDKFNLDIKKIIKSNKENELLYRNGFNEFLEKIGGSVGRIGNHLINPSSIGKITVIHKKDNIVFSFSVYSDKLSEFKIELINEYTYHLNNTYLLNGMKKITGYVYFLESQFGYKIGCTCKIKNRLKHFGVKLPFEFKTHSIIKCDYYTKLERELHNLLLHKKINGEWFDLSENDFLEIDIILGNQKLIREKFDNN